MKVLIQAGNLGSSVIDHLTSPITEAQNVDQVLIFCHHPGPAIPKLEYHCPPSLITHIPVLAILFEMINLFRISLFDRSAIVVGYLSNPHGLIAFTIAKLSRKKLAIYLIAGRAELFTKGSVKGIDFETSSLPWKGNIILKMLEHSDSIITTGTVTKNFLINRGIRESKIFPIISPVNISRFYRQKYVRSYDVLSVGSLLPIKHHEILLKAISEVKQKYPNVKACIVGNGPRMAELVRLATELNIKDNVEFAGFQRNVPYYYNSSKIFVHTSEREGFPNVVLEAMSCHTVCVVSKCGDIIDIAKNNINSIVISQFDDYHGFANAIINLLDNEDLRNSLSKNASESLLQITKGKSALLWGNIFTSMNAEVQ